MKLALIIGSLLSGLSVVFGAFGAHALNKILPPHLLNTYSTGVTYQYYHSFALLIVGLLIPIIKNNLKVPTISFLIGILLFSGGCYFYALSEIKFFAMVVPFGGVSFIIGWVALALSLIKYRERLPNF